jgi:hypothetical protein
MALDPIYAKLLEEHTDIEALYLKLLDVYSIAWQAREEDKLDLLRESGTALDTLEIIRPDLRAHFVQRFGWQPVSRVTEWIEALDNGTDL